MANYETDVLMRMRADSKEVDEAFDRTQDSAQTTGAIIEATMIAALIKFGAEASNVAMNFEKEMATVQAISGSTASEMEALEETARTWGATTEHSATAVAQAMQYQALAGMEVNEIMEATGPILDMATASNLDMATAADIATDTMSMYGYEVSELDNVMDIFISGQQNANTSTQQLFEALKMVGPAANSMGVSLEETSAALMVMADAGIKGGSAGTALNAMFTDMNNKVDGTTLSFGEFSVEMYDAEENFIGLMPLFEAMNDGLEGMGTASKKAALGSVFQSRSLRAVSIILDGNVDKMIEYNDTLEDSAGTSEETAEIMRDTFAGSVKTLESAFEELMISVGSLINQFLEPLIKVLTHAITILGKVPTPILEIVVSLGILAAAFKTVTIAMRLFGATGSKIPALFGPVGLSIMAIGTAAFLTMQKIDDLNSVITDEFIGASEAMIGASDATRESVTNLNDAYKIQNDALLTQKESLEKSIEAMDEAGLATDGLEESLEKTNEKIAENSEAWVEAWSPGGDISSALGSTGDVFIEQLEDMHEKLTFFAEKGPEQYREFATESLANLETYGGGVKELLDAQVLLFQDNAEEILTTNGETWDNMSEETKIQLQGLITTQSESFGTILTNAEEHGITFLESMKTEHNIQFEELSNYEQRKIGQQMTADENSLLMLDEYFILKHKKENEGLTWIEEQQMGNYEKQLRLMGGFNEDKYETWKTGYEEELTLVETESEKIGEAQVDAQEEGFWAKWNPFRKTVEDEQANLASESKNMFSAPIFGSAGAGGQSVNSQALGGVMSQSGGPSIGGMGGSGGGGIASYGASSGGGGSTSNSNVSNMNTSNRTVNVYPSNWDKPTQKRMEDEQKLQDWNNL